MNGPLEVAVGRLADLVGNQETGTYAGQAMSCSEADAVASVLAVGGHHEAAAAFLAGHAGGDDGDDAHASLLDDLDEGECCVVLGPAARAYVAELVAS